MTAGEYFHYSTGMSNLLDATRELLKAATKQISLAEIARGAGEPVEYDWLKRFASDKPPDSTVSRVQHLHDYLITLKLNGARSRAAG